ncbi:Ski complex subunit Rec14 [Vermiconidia calcicola]|uniref:Ski complex subunit Rec14 n=1 Tax=Vermiconidia calcicola TaxID=1690605 RepID=A0ACC3N4S5_9PEZI|nr:Ski complex subunit Rec14 [Vermiconidia calcicola]
MAALPIPSRSFLAAFLPIARAQLLPQSSKPTVTRIPLLQRLRASSPLFPAALTPIPSLLSELWEGSRLEGLSGADIWDGLLNAVPKKKTSHMKKRHRQLASGKHLRDVTALNKCSACGRAKRAHVLCPYCVQSIRRWFGTNFKSAKELDAEEDARLDRINEERRLQGRKPLDVPKKLKDEDVVERKW